ncbi:uncharacterized protein [Nicotiana sylvestris]|uniref:uncharacterized protein n=1 Tax=Nicotiana sylvestris TaxID=4096 RepID=UPI00388C7A22
MNFGGSWDKFLPLAEFAYNNSLQSSIQMAPYEALYGRRGRSLIDWFEPSEARLLGTDLVQDALEKAKMIQERLRAAQLRQKSFANRKVRDVSYMVSEKVLLKVAYELALPPILSSVHPVFHVSMLRKYIGDPSHGLDFSTVQLDDDLTYDMELIAILGR